MRSLPGFSRERKNGRMLLVPTPEAWIVAERRAEEAARIAVRAGLRVRGSGKDWKVVALPKVENCASQ